MSKQWSIERAMQWQLAQGWLCGFNYLPRTAVNFIDMWQAENFDPPIIAQELEWAAKIGFNTLRTNLPYVVWKNDADGLFERVDQFLSICQKNNIKVMLTLLDDCEFSGEGGYLGEQHKPQPRVHNGQARASPGRLLVMDKAEWPSIEQYVREIVRRFTHDPRILIWDLYNEPSNRMVFSEAKESQFSEKLEAFSLCLMENVFTWVRDENPIQPLTVAAWHAPSIYDRSTPIYEHIVDVRAMELSDIVSFHNYLPLDNLAQVLDVVEAYRRPLICSEWLARHAGSLMQEQLPIFKERLIGCYQWGLVKGKTQTNIPWPEYQQRIKNWQDQWFHDLLHENGEPYDAKEVALISKLNGVTYNRLETNKDMK